MQVEVGYRRYSTAYVPHEDGARMAKAGMWRSEFVPANSSPALSGRHMGLEDAKLSGKSESSCRS